MRKHAPGDVGLSFSTGWCVDEIGHLELAAFQTTNADPDAVLPELGAGGRTPVHYHKGVEEGHHITLQRQVSEALPKGSP